MRISIKPNEVFIKLLLVASFLLVAHATGLIFKFYIGHDHVFGLVPLFDFDTEKNIPTAFSAGMLLISSTLLLQISIFQKKLEETFLPWLGLAVIFAFLALDEMFSFHENLTNPVSEMLHTSGMFLFAWVVPYSLLLLVFLAIYCRFIYRLPKKFRMLMILSGVTYVTGVLGFEFIGGYYAELYDIQTIGYATLTTIEEFVEMLGVMIFIFTLLTYLVIELKQKRLSINRGKLILELD